jgi:hypothetical protein
MMQQVAAEAPTPVAQAPSWLDVPTARAAAPQRSLEEIMGEPTSLAERMGMKSPFQKPRPVEEQIRTGLGIIPGAARAITGATVEPAARASAGVMATAAKQVQGTLAALPQYLKGEFGEAEKTAHKVAAESVDIPGLGNVNWMRLSKEGKLDPAETIKVGGGTTAEGLAGILNLVAPMSSSLKGAFARGAALTGGGEARKEGSTPESIIASAAVGGATQAALQRLFGGVLTKKKAERVAEKLGVKPDIIIRTKGLSPKERGLQLDYFQRSKLKSLDPDINMGAVESVADDFTSGLKKLHDLKTQAGKKIGLTKEGIIAAPTAKQRMVSVAPLRKQLQSNLAKKGVYIDRKGNLNFGKSVWKNQKGDQDFLNNLWNTVKKKRGISESDALLLRERLQNDLYAGKGIERKITSSDVIGQDFERALTKDIHIKNKKLAELDSIFAELSNLVKGGRKVTKSTSPLLEQEAISGANSFNFIRRSLGAGNRQNLKVLEKIQQAGRKYNIDELKDVVKNRRLAQTADDAYNIDLTTMPTSLTGRLGQVAGAARTAPMNPVQAAQMVKQAFQKDPKFVKTLIKLAKPEKAITKATKEITQRGLGAPGQVLSSLLAPLLRKAEEPAQNLEAIFGTPTAPSMPGAPEEQRSLEDILGTPTAAPAAPALPGAAPTKKKSLEEIFG